MNTPSLIRNLCERVLPPPKIQFPCPVCQRDIEIKKVDTGADLICPHCTAWIAAPIPSLNLGAQIRDENVIRVRQFQQAHGRELVELKRGRLEASVLRKQKRMEEQGVAAESAAGAAAARSEGLNVPMATATFEKPVSDPSASLALAPNAPGTAIAGMPSPSPSRAPRLHRPQNAVASFRPLDSVPFTLSNEANVLSWEEEPVADGGSPGSFLSRGGKTAALAGGAAILIALFALAESELGEKREHLLQEQIKKQERLEESLSIELENARKAEAIDLARKALASPAWTGLLPYVRHPNRVRPLMERYYAQKPWSPIAISEIVGGAFDELEGHRFFAFGAKDASGESFIVGLEHTSEGWKIDWEVLVPLAQLEWDRFIADHPFEARTIRASAIRRTPTDEMLLLNSIPEEDAFGVMLWCTDITAGSLYAVLRKESALAQQLAGLLSVSQGRKVILDVAFLPSGDGTRKDLVAITRVVTMGWTILEEHAPEGSRNRNSDAIRNAVGLPIDQEYAWHAGSSPWERSTWKDPQRSRR